MNKLKKQPVQTQSLSAMTILQTIDKTNNKINSSFNPQRAASADQAIMISSLNAATKGAADTGVHLPAAPNRQLYFVNLDNYLQQQYRLNNNKLLLGSFYNQQDSQKLHQPILDQPADRADKDRKGRSGAPQWTAAGEELSEEAAGETAPPNAPSTASNCFSCFDRITDFVERRLVNRQPVYNLIKCFIVLLTIAQFAIFLLSMITYKNNEQKHFYSKHDYFILGTNLALLNALLSTIFYLYSIIGEVFPLLALMTSLQAFYSILELLALLTEPIKVQYIYIAFLMLASLQTFSMLLFVVMLRIKKIQEGKMGSRSLSLNASYV